MKREEKRVKRDKLESIGDNHPLDLVVWWRHTFENLHASKCSSSTLRFMWNHTAKSNQHKEAFTQLKITSKKTKLSHKQLFQILYTTKQNL